MFTITASEPVFEEMWNLRHDWNLLTHEVLSEYPSVLFIDVKRVCFHEVKYFRFDDTQRCLINSVLMFKGFYRVAQKRKQNVITPHPIPFWNREASVNNPKGIWANLMAFLPREFVTVFCAFDFDDVELRYLVCSNEVSHVDGIQPDPFAIASDARRACDGSMTRGSLQDRPS